MTAGKPKLIELNRDIVSLEAAGRRYGLDDLDMLGPLGSKSLKWLELLERKCVVVLAGAESGKTQQFRERVTALRGALRPIVALAPRCWRTAVGCNEGWVFRHPRNIGT